jgi:DNA polymerase II large subunit
MTAVEWLWEQIDEILPFSVDTETGIKLYNAKEQAKEMEKEQIEDAYADGVDDEYEYHINDEPRKNTEQYYEQTYGGNK